MVPPYWDTFFEGIFLDLVQVQKWSFALGKTPDFELDLVCNVTYPEVSTGLWRRLLTIV
jgi:hypothetical protein